MLPADFAAAAASAVANSRGRTLIVIDGPAGAGKTTTAQALVWSMRGREVSVIHMDDLYDGWDGLNDELTGYLRDDLVPQLAEADPIEHRRYDWHAGRFADLPVVVPGGDVVIVEGVGAAQPVLRNKADLSLWVEADPEVCRRRWLARDGEQMRAHIEPWFADQTAHHDRFRTRAECDLIVPSDG